MTIDSSLSLLGLIEFGEFALVALLGFFLMKLIYWETVLQNNRGPWLQALREASNQSRQFRQQAEKVAAQSWTVSLPLPIQKTVQWLQWILWAVGLAKRARS